MAIQIAANQIKNGTITATQLANSAITPSKMDLSENYTFTGAVAGQTPTADAHLTTKSYVDSIAGANVFWKDPAEVASTGNVNLSNPGTSSFDGVTISSGQRVLIFNQSTNSENGVYKFNGSSSAMTRTDDCNTAAALQSCALFINKGNNYANQAFVETENISNLGSDAVLFVRFSGLGTVVAGSGLSKSGDTLSCNVDDASLEIASDALKIKNSGVTNDMLAGSISAGKLAGSIGDSLLSTISSSNKVSGSAVQLNGAGGLENSSGLKISDLGVSAGMLAGSIPDSKLSTISTADKVSGSAIQLASGSGLEDSTGLKISTGGVSNDMLAGSINDSKLSTISSGNKVSGSAVQLATGGGLADSSGLKVDTNGIETAMIGANQVTSAKINFEPSRETLDTSGGSATVFTLSDSLPANFDDVLVFRNGLLCERVGSSPSGVDQYTSAVSSGTCTITFGSAPASTDKVICTFFAIKS